MKITRSSDEYRTIAQLVYEGLYVLGVEDIYGITRFNCDEIADGKWGQFSCNATALDRDWETHTGLHILTEQ